MSGDTATHLIIAGVTRAASTSLFTYLADHPDVCRSTIKETRFFLDDDYPMPRMHGYHEGIAAYDKFFPHAKPGQVRLEATPDYLYTPAAAERMRNELPGARVVILLREPVSRLISWYRYARQNGRIGPEMSLDQYVAAQDERGEQPMRAMSQGRYSRFLPRWLEVFDRPHILVTTHEALQRDAGPVVKAACALAGLDPGFYDGYEYRVINESREVSFPGVERGKHRLIWAIKPYVHDQPMIRGALRKVRRAVEGVLGAGVKQDTQVHMSERTRSALDDYYKDEPEQLAKLLGVATWMWDAGGQTPIGAAP